MSSEISPECEILIIGIKESLLGVKKSLDLRMLGHYIPAKHRETIMFWTMLASAALPYAVDALTGASKKQQNALNERDNVIANIIADSSKRAGTSATDSIFFKTGQALIDKQQKKTAEVQTQTAAATGASSEQQIGQIAANNDNTQDATLNNLGNAEGERNALLDRIDGMKVGQEDTKIATASNNLNSQNQLMGGLAGLIPQLLAKNKKKTTVDLLPQPEEVTNPIA
jgi:hypothetical protein